jgi:transposase-like protein
MGWSGSGRRGSKLTAVQRAVAIELVLSGEATPSEVADAYGVTPSLIRTYTRNLPRKGYRRSPSPEVRKAAVSAWLGGMPTAEVARAFEISHSCLWCWTTERPRAAKRYPREEIRAMYLAGTASRAEIAKHFRCSENTVWCMTSDLPRRRPGRRPAKIGPISCFGNWT